MSNICCVNESFVLATITKTKLMYFDEYFVTTKELNYISEVLRKEYNKRDIPVIITKTREALSYWIYTPNVIVAKRPISDIEDEYTGYLPIEVLKILWDDKFILKHIIKFREEELERVKQHLYL